LKRFKNQLGITLMELIITVAIISILAAVGTPMYNGYISAAKNADAQNTLKTIFLMQKNYFSENYCYYVIAGPSDQSISINQYLLGSTTPTTGPIPVGATNDFSFFISPGAVGSAGTCTGSNSNDYIASAQSKTTGVTYTINQQNVKTGF
jgi:type IV pilus assembly protein PilE